MSEQPPAIFTAEAKTLQEHADTIKRLEAELNEATLSEEVRTYERDDANERALKAEADAAQMREALEAMLRDCPSSDKGHAIYNNLTARAQAHAALATDAGRKAADVLKAARALEQHWRTDECGFHEQKREQLEGDLQTAVQEWNADRDTGNG